MLAIVRRLRRGSNYDNDERSLRGAATRIKKGSS
jgi:hypothetical protein